MTFDQKEYVVDRSTARNFTVTIHVTITTNSIQDEDDVFCSKIKWYLYMLIMVLHSLKTKDFRAKQIALQLLLVYILYTENQYLLKELPLRHLGLQIYKESLH